MGTVNSSSSESSDHQPNAPSNTALLQNGRMYHNVTVSAAHIRVIRVLQAWYGNRLDISYEVRLGSPYQNGDLVYENSFTYNHHIISQDIYHYILMDFVRFGNCLVAAIGQLGEFPDVVRIYLFRPRFDLSPAEKRGLVPIRCFHGTG